MKLYSFSQFINETYEFDELDRMRKLGLVDDAEYDAQKREIRREAYMASGAMGIEDIKQALETEGAKQLMALGLHMVSSRTQLINGNIIFSLDQNYAPSNGWGIGFFAGPKLIRRMMPKGINLGVWGRTSGSMDFKIKRFSHAEGYTKMSDLEFFDKAMQWAAENIDFEHAKANPSSYTWKYYTKKRSPSIKKF